MSTTSARYRMPGRKQASGTAHPRSQFMKYKATSIVKFYQTIGDLQHLIDAMVVVASVRKENLFSFREESVRLRIRLGTQGGK